MASTETVVVGCKLPQGLILNVKGETVRVNGRATYSMPNANRKVQNDPHSIVYGDGLTTVGKDFWDQWCVENKSLPAFVKGFIYASGKRQDAEARAKESEDLKTGLEPIDPLAPGMGLKADDATLKELSKKRSR